MQSLREIHTKDLKFKMCTKDTNCCCENLLLILCMSFPSFILAGGLLLGLKAVPDLKRYLDEERYHVKTLCTFQYANISEFRNCSYIKSCTGREFCYTQVYGSYPCYQVHVTFKHTNNSVIQAEAFETAEDSEKTDHECATYSCKDPDDIHDLVNDLEGEKTFDCFHHPLKLDYVYIDTANLPLVLFLFVCGLLLIIAGFIVLFFL